MAFNTSSPIASDRLSRRARRRALRLRLCAGLALVETVAAAQPVDKEACMRSYEQSQRARKASRLLEARQELTTCIQSCPSGVRPACSAWLDDTERRVPTLLVDAQDADGRPLSQVRVLVDDRLVAVHVEDRPIPLDPGEHVVRFEADPSMAVVQRLTIREGEKGRHVSVRFEREGLSSPAQSPPPAPSTAFDAPAAAPAVTPGAPGGPIQPPAGETATARPSGVPVGAYVAGGIGALGLAGAVVFGVLRANDVGSLDECRPTCGPSDVAAANRDLAIGAASLAVALVGGGTAALIYLTRSRTPAPAGARAASGPTVRAAALRSGAQAMVEVRF